MSENKKKTPLVSAEEYFLAEAAKQGSLQQNEILDKSDEFGLSEEDYDKLCGELTAKGVIIKDDELAYASAAP